MPSSPPPTTGGWRKGERQQEPQVRSLFERKQGLPKGKLGIRPLTGKKKTDPKLGHLLAGLFESQGGLSDQTFIKQKLLDYDVLFRTLLKASLYSILV